MLSMIKWIRTSRLSIKSSVCVSVQLMKRRGLVKEGEVPDDDPEKMGMPPKPDTHYPNP
jgi:hypothetical protein